MNERILAGFAEADISLIAMAEALSRSTDYRVLRRLVPRATLTSSIGQDTKTGILIDIETTGLDARKDEVIELGMVKFDYLADGQVVGVRDVFSSFAEPTMPIPPEVTALTGITDEMVAGQRIDEAAVSAFVDSSVIVIAHNAGFDRKFAERYWPIFERKAWGCSATEVEWRKHGFEGSRLGYLLNGAGFFHQAHRAVDDCHALLEILALVLPMTATSALAVLLAQARKKTMRIWAEQSPFDLKDALRRRGYRWSDGSDGRPRSWYVDVGESALEDEITFLRSEVYLRDMEPRLQRITAFTRFSIRA
jgi:DNA polymerase III subunit epsilon